MKLQTSNFAAGLRVRNTKQIMKNCVKKGRGLGHVTYFWILPPPLLSSVRMKLQTSNFAAGSMVTNTKQKMKNWAKKGRGLAHVTYFWILGPPLLSPVRMKLQTSNFAAGSRVRNTKQINEKLGKGGVAKVTWPTFEFWDPPYYLRLEWSYKRQILQPDRR